MVVKDCPKKKPFEINKVEVNGNNCQTIKKISNTECVRVFRSRTTDSSESPVGHLQTPALDSSSTHFEWLHLVKGPT